MEFVCEKAPLPGMRPKHRRKLKSTWRYEVQSGIRDLRPPMPTSDMLLLGYDDDGLAAVVWTYERDGPGHIKIQAVARALRCRGEGRGEEAMEETLERLAARMDAAGLHTGVVEGWIHHQNTESQALAERFRMFHSEDDAGYLGWWIPIILDHES